MTHKMMLALLASLSLVAVSSVTVSSAVASHPQALLVAPDPYCHDLPRFGFSSFNIYGVGERVTSVRWGGIAAQMGLESGDLILSMNGFPLSYHGSWNDALRNAMNNGGWVQLTIRDVRTGFIATRETFVGSPGYGPITPYSHVTTYHGPTTSHIVVGGGNPVGPITMKKLIKKFEEKNNP
jgi:hypothetical protein